MFFEYDQNNSGGGFHYDEKAGIGHRVIVEADDAQEANYRAQCIGLYFDGCETGQDCSCCGDRWYEAWGGEKGDPVPMIFGSWPVENGNILPNADGDEYNGFSWYEGYEGFVHYKDGRVEGFNLVLIDVEEEPLALEA